MQAVIEKLEALAKKAFNDETHAYDYGWELAAMRYSGREEAFLEAAQLIKTELQNKSGE